MWGWCFFPELLRKGWAVICEVGLLWGRCVNLGWGALLGVRGGGGGSATRVGGKVVAHGVALRLQLPGRLLLSLALGWFLWLGCLVWFPFIGALWGRVRRGCSV